MNEKLNFEAFYPHPPQRVWQALTDPKALAKWLLPTDFRPRIGIRFRFDGLDRSEKATVEGRVLAVEEGKRLSYEWNDGESGSPSVVTWTLQPKDGGTLVRLEHAAAEPEPYVFIEAGLNWRYALYASLPVMLMLLRDAGSRRPPTPVVYVAEEPKEESPRRAGFRQEEAATCR